MKSIVELLILVCCIYAYSCKNSEGKLLNRNLKLTENQETVSGNQASSNTNYSLGKLSCEIIADSVIKLIGQPDSVSTEFQAGADGSFVNVWFYNNMGLKIEMYSLLKGESKKVRSILALYPCNFQTTNGIQIGSHAIDIYKNYKNEIDYSISDSLNEVVIGSIYDGMIFSLEKGKVNKIFIGAAAE